MNRLTGSSALAVEVQVLRAGAAASAERIKELEARVAELTEEVEDLRATNKALALPEGSVLISSFDWSPPVAKEPTDEALLWAREQAKQLREAPNDPTRDLSAEIDAGMHDDELSDMAHGYRAGAAASAERVKALEARVAELELFVAQIAHRFVPKKMPLGLLRANCWSESSQARALLKEPDQ